MSFPEPWLTLIAGQETLTGKTLQCLIDGRTAQLSSQGVRAGQVILVPDRPALELALLTLGLNRMGAGVFPYRADLAVEERLSLARMAGAEWAWDPSSQSLLPLSDGSHASPCCPDEPLALLIRTSGSSGQPRIAMHGPSGVGAAAHLSNAALDAEIGATWLCCLRLSHIAGAVILYRALASGARLVLQDGFSAEAVAADLVKHQVSHVSLVPPMLARLIELGCRPPPSLRCVLVGGQALSPELAKRALVAGWPIQVSYGMTETCALIALAGPSDPNLFTPLAGIECAAPQCSDPPAPIALRAPSLMLGYANPERRPGLGLADGWFKTADLGWVTAEGRLRLFGRADDLCTIGGTKVSLLRVAQRLASVPGVTEAEVIALPDPVWGARLVGVYCGLLAEEALGSWCEANLAGPERPRALLRLENLPRLASGKVDRQCLTEIVQGLLGR